MGHWLRVLEAMLLLLLARALVRLVPMRHWRASLGPIVPPAAAELTFKLKQDPRELGACAAAVHPVRAAHRRALVHLPGHFKCLPQAMALQWMLRRRKVPSVLTIAALPAHLRASPDDLHAWVEAAGVIQIGQSDLPYRPLLQLGSTTVQVQQ